MIYPTVLIFSSLEDVHVSAVVPQLSARTLPLVCDLSRFGVDFSASVSSASDFGLTLQTSDGDRFSLERLEAVWWRRPQPFDLNKRFVEPVARYVQQENLAFWGGALALVPQTIRWYNHFDANRLADRKLTQLAIARHCGMEIPATCVTSCPNEAIAFIEKHGKVAFKAFSGSEEVWRPTRLFGDEMRPDLRNLTVCPVIFQKYVEGVADFRVTVIDEHIEAVAFDISKSRYPVDVRIDTRTPCVKAQIPDALAEKLILFLHTMGLRFGAFDLRKTSVDEFIFFEVNPAGQFLYLDRLAGTSLAKAMAHALSSSRGDCQSHDFCEKTALAPLEFEVDNPFAIATPSLNKHLR